MSKRRPGTRAGDRGEYRTFYCAMADDPDIHAMSPGAFKLLAMLRLSLPAIGIGVVYPSKLVDQMGVDRQELDRCFAELEAPKPGLDRGWIMRERNIVWIVRALEFDPSLTPTNMDKHVPFVRRLIAQLPPASAIVAAFKDYYQQWFIGLHIPNPNPIGKATDRVSQEEGGGSNRNPLHTHPDRVSKPIAVPKQEPKSGDLDQERGQAPSDAPPEPRAPAGAAPLASALAQLPGDAIKFLARFYPRGRATRDRRTDVAEQVVATLALGTPLRDGEIVRAYTPERLAAKCREVMREGVRDPDLAIVVLLSKLADTSDGSAPGVAEARAVQRTEQEAAGDLECALGWIADHPEIDGTVQAELRRMGFDPVAPDRDLVPIIATNRRILRQALALDAWRAAGEPEPANTS